MKLSVSRKPATPNLFALMIALVAISLTSIASAQSRGDCMAKCQMMPMPGQRHSCMASCPSDSPKPRNRWCEKLKHPVPVAVWTESLCTVEETPEVCMFGEIEDIKNPGETRCKTFGEARAELEMGRPPVLVKNPDPDTSDVWVYMLILSGSLLVGCGFLFYRSRRLQAVVRSRIWEGYVEIEANMLTLDLKRHMEEQRLSAQRREEEALMEEALMKEAYAEIEAFLADDLREQIDQECDPN